MKRTWKYKIRPIIISGDVCIITLSDGSAAYCDASDYEVVKGYNWSIEKNSKLCPKSSLGMLSNVIMGNPPHGMLIDHIDRNARNNRRSNLRLATYSQNSMNRSPYVGKSSSFKGVTFRSDRGTWLACIRINGRLKKIGTFKIEEDAARAYDAFASHYFGDFAVVNFP